MMSKSREKVLDLRPVFGVEARITIPAESTGGGQPRGTDAKASPRLCRADRAPGVRQNR